MCLSWQLYYSNGKCRRTVKNNSNGTHNFKQFSRSHGLSVSFKGEKQYGKMPVLNGVKNKTKQKNPPCTVGF